MEKPRSYPRVYILLPFLLLLFFSAVYMPPNFFFGEAYINVTDKPSGYVVNTEMCKIPDMDPWSDGIKPFYRREKYVSCSKYQLLTYVEKNATRAVLKIDGKAAKRYGKRPITCCYKNVTRPNNTIVPDVNISISKCENFDKEIDITGSTVVVSCRQKSEIYKNVHVAVTTNPKLQAKLESSKNVKTLGLLMIGIDSISRLNFIRTMPKTYSYLKRNGWIEYYGYNKIADNTFPNLMAMLTGRSPSDAYSTCNPTKAGKLETCGFIWEDYRRLGYVTAYAEDESQISTFNYNNKVGFKDEPTDFYFRPYMCATTSELKLKTVDEMDYCTGPETQGERVFNLIRDFTGTFSDYPKFGLFWMNSFSHNKLNSPTRMEEKVLKLLEDLSDGKVLDNTVIIFLSDHGIRFGNVRATPNGWFEERLPYLFFWVPKWFREQRPVEYGNLKRNARQLTTPYHMYMTIQDILTLSNLNYTAKRSAGCPGCGSMFGEVAAAKSCKDVGIEPHWCTCHGYKPIDSLNRLVIDTVNMVLYKFDRMIKDKKLTKKCSSYEIGTVHTSSISTKIANVPQNETYLLVIFETIPKAIFEVTSTIRDNEVVAISPVSRLDRIGSTNNCIKDSELQLYCFCRKYVTGKIS